MKRHLTAGVHATRTQRSRRKQQGDSLLEVMAALTITAIGVLGITSMQSATARSNRDATETKVALSFARTWLERVKRDALAWQAPGVPPRGQILAGRNLGVPNSADYFVPTAPLADTWSAPVPLHNGESSGANARGIDVGAPDPIFNNAIVPGNATFYCVNFKFVTEEIDALGRDEVIRATARVWWARGGVTANYTGAGIVAARANGCASVIPTALELASNDVRVVYLSTLLTYTPP